MEAGKLLEITQSFDNGLVNVWDGKLEAFGGALPFAHISHPTSPEDLARLVPQNPRVAKLIGRKNNKAGPGLLHTLAQSVIGKLDQQIYGKTELRRGKRKTTGAHMLIGYYPHDWMRVNWALSNLQPKMARGEYLSKDEIDELQFTNRILTRLLDGVIDLHARGVRVISFGGYTSIATLNCKWMYDKLRELDIDLLITPGSYGTAESVRQIVPMICKKCGIVPRDAQLVVVGCSGAIMRIVNHEIVPRFGKTILVGRNETRSKKTMDSIIEVHPNLAGRVSYMPTEDINQAIALGDVVITATNEHDARALNMRPESFKNGSAVVDVSIPSNITPEIAELERIVVVKAGNFQLPANCRTDSSSAKILGFDHPSQAHACFSEACMWALIGEWKLFIRDFKKLTERMLIEPVCDPKMFHYIKGQLKKWGFRLASLRDLAGEEVSKAKFEQIRQLRQVSPTMPISKLAESY